MILIRADGSGKVGAGHLMRCMTIAEKICEKEEVFFLTSSSESAQMVEKKGFPAAVLKCYQNEAGDKPQKDVGGHQKQAGMAEELLELSEWIAKKKPSWILVDSYQVDAHYLGEVSRQVRTAYLDDSGVKVYPVDLIINYNVYAEQEAYEKLYQGKQTRFLIGSGYIPIRSAFTEKAYEVREKLKNILILTGGGDYYQLAGKIMSAFAAKPEFREFRFHLICGYYNNQVETLRKEAAHYGNFKIYENVVDIWNLMGECDLAITAGGTTVYELCALGLPFLGYSFADNQHPVLSWLQEKEIAPNCGDYREKKEELFETLAEHIIAYKDLQVRSRISKRQKELVDGQGASRIAEKLMS